MKLDIKGEGIKAFKIEVKEFNLQERVELNNLLYQFFNNKEGMFGPAIDIVRMATDLDDEGINNYSNEEIFQIAIAVSNHVNKKKSEEIIFLINIYISYKGLNNNGDNGFRFPYKALSPVTGKQKMFRSMDDVYTELEACYDEIMEKNINAIGETLYTEHFFFCNTGELLDENVQKRIKEYSYCKTFSTPPYPSLIDTPANIIDEFMLIEKELNYLKAKDSNGNK